MSEFTDLRDGMRQFTEERDWGRFHDPKSLVLAIAGEIGEVAELFQWLPANSAREQAVVDPLRARVTDEMADVLLYLVRLADVLDVDLFQAARDKLGVNSARFVPGQVRGVAPDKH